MNCQLNFLEQDVPKFKLLLSFLVVSSFFYEIELLAQSNDTLPWQTSDYPLNEYIENSSKCRSSSYKRASFVEFKSSYSVYLKLQDIYGDEIILLNENNGNEVHLQPTDELILDDLEKDGLYSLIAENSCGDNDIFYSFTTEPGKNAVEVINLARPMFELMTDFGVQEKETALPMFEFLNQASDEQAHFYERLSFYQQKHNNEFLYDENIRETKLIERFESTLASDCSCEVLVLENDFEAGTRSRPYWNRYVSRVVENQRYTVGDADVVEFMERKGPAKILTTMSQAWQNNPCDKNVRAEFGSWNAQYHEFADKSGLSANLICNDYNELPADCGCSREVVFCYNYSSKVETFANTLGRSWRCNSHRQASAAADDNAIAYCYESEREKPGGPDTITGAQIINAYNNAAASACHTDIDTSFFLAWGGFLDVLFEEFEDADFSSPTGIRDAITDASWSSIGSALQTVWGRRLYDESRCTHSAGQIHTMDGCFEQDLLPNRILTFVVASNGAARAEGQRSWRSYAEIRSAFAMTMVVTPGANEQCCTPWAAGYSGGAYDVPRHSGENWDIMGTYLNLFGMDDCLYTQNGGSYSKGDYGFCARPAERDCNVDVEWPENEGTGDRSSSDSEFEGASLSKTARLFNVQGILMKEFQSSGMIDIRNQLRNTNLISGVYFIHIVDHEYQTVTTEKIFIR